ALSVGRAVTDVARPAAAAARPVLRVVAGGLDKIPTSTVAGPTARGRLLILIASILAAGLIYINVGKLEAGDGYGRYAARSTELARDNTILRAKVAQLGSSERIERYARKLGLVMPQPEQFKFVRGKRGDPLKAIRTYTAPTTATPLVNTPSTPQSTSPASGTGTADPVQGGATTPPAAVTPPVEHAPVVTPAPASPGTTGGDAPAGTTGGAE
ncbi:MAG: hypothetical protein WAP35_05540, partial [Solirubrobacterales bacterium]